MSKYADYAMDTGTGDALAGGYKTGGLMGAAGAGIAHVVGKQFKLAKSQMTKTARGDQGRANRKQSAMQLEMARDKKKRGSSVSVKRTTISGESKRIMRDTTSCERPMIGSELIPSIATNRMPAISLKLGKRISVDAVTPFLKNLSQSAKVQCQYGGRLKSKTSNTAANPINDQGERMVISQVFRHCWGDKLFNTPTVGGSGNPTDQYPTVTGNSTLGPGCTTKALPPTGTLQATLSSPYVDHRLGDNNFSVISRPDLEDMMYNLNKLKLKPNRLIYQNATTNLGQAIGNTGGIGMFYQNVAAFLSNRHFRTSAIMANNIANSSYDGEMPSLGWAESTYKYNAVFKHGTVKYDFKNCEMTGARVEVIVYKQKKNKLSSDKCTDFSSSTTYTDGRPLDNIGPVIGEGYINTIIDKMGTEQLGGRQPLNTDILSNPMYPLLPELKKTKQNNMRFKEISRTAFALTSGAQRTLEIVLPGDEYDPANIPKLDPSALGGTSINRGIAIMDDHCYTIVISVCGVKMTRMISTLQTDATAPTDTICGEIHCPFNVEYLCTYTEHIGAAKYKTPPPIALFNDALVCDTSVEPETGALVQVPVRAVTVVPVENCVRSTDRINVAATPGLAATTQAVSYNVDLGYTTGNPVQS